MKTFWLALLTFPSSAISLGIALGLASRETMGEANPVPPALGFIPLMSFVISIALIFVFPNSKEWRIAALTNGIPLSLGLLLGIFIAIVGV
jgi:hypothetical protein